MPRPPRCPLFPYTTLFRSGVFRSKDGGRSWERVLYRDDRTGAVDLAIDPANPDVLYAGLWEVFRTRSEEHTSELQSHSDLVCRLLLEKKKIKPIYYTHAMK